MGTFVKVFCFDAGGVVLALSSGILFGGVIKGAVFSAAAATIGSMVSFGLAKIDSPLREKALEVLEEYPSLRGIEKVVAKDGVKAVLTLRLAPLLPIPIGMYNYIYGVTNVPLFDFAAGIFLGSLKPYLLDSYLGYFGKNLIDGSSGEESQDIILFVVLGLSILIGVFASELAGETWEAVQMEIEAEKEETINSKEENDSMSESFLGFDLPQWAMSLKLGVKDAAARVEDVVDAECRAEVWNYTKSEEIPDQLNPALFQGSPELVGKEKALNLTQYIFDGLVFSPILLGTFIKVADPNFEQIDHYQNIKQDVFDDRTDVNESLTSIDANMDTQVAISDKSKDLDSNNLSDADFLEILLDMRATINQRLEDIEEKLTSKTMSDDL